MPLPQTEQDIVATSPNILDSRRRMTKSLEDQHAELHARLKERFGDNKHPEDYIALSLPDMFQRPNSRGEMKPRDQGDMEYEAHWESVHEQKSKIGHRPVASHDFE